MTTQKRHQHLRLHNNCGRLRTVLKLCTTGIYMYRSFGGVLCSRFAFLDLLFVWGLLSLNWVRYLPFPRYTRTLEMVPKQQYSCTLALAYYVVFAETFASKEVCPRNFLSMYLVNNKSFLDHCFIKAHQYWSSGERSRKCETTVIQRLNRAIYSCELIENVWLWWKINWKITKRNSITEEKWLSIRLTIPWNQTSFIHLFIIYKPVYAKLFTFEVADHPSCRPIVVDLVALLLQTEVNEPDSSLDPAAGRFMGLRDGHNGNSQLYITISARYICKVDSLMTNGQR